MDKKAYMDEQLNIRCFYLRLIKRLPALLLFAVAGAVLGILLYSAVTRITQPEVYEARTQLYLHFVKDASDDKVYDYYNAYTWNDLIRTDAVREKLEDEQVKQAARAEFRKILSNEDYDEKQVEEDYLSGTGNLVSVEAQILSDIRVLWIVASSQGKEPVANALYASLWMSHALAAYGEENEVFRSIEISKLPTLEEVSRPITYPDRLKTAGVAGAVLGAVLALFGLLVLHLLDEAVYVPEDAEKRYGLPVLAVTGSGKLPGLLRREALENLTRLSADGKAIRVYTAQSEDACRKLMEEERPVDNMEYLPLGGSASVSGKADASSVPDNVPDSFDSEAPVFLGVQTGDKKAALTAHVLAQLKARGMQVQGIVMTGADGVFLGKYYRLNEDTGRTDE